ncbi:hypothetical protein KY328_04550 [Candidatus Woesearchaeota archaeon]|nr:hypothetical protein [Candidatus Woesearchaeota archaeon]MBW3022169.1 hypothetical protein [Candidatus Woesearchaeota archaeon]
MKTILVVLGMGGHTNQMLRLLEKLGNKYNYEFVVGHDDKTSAPKVKDRGPIFIMKNPRLMKDNNIFKIILNMIPATIDSFRILRKSRAKVLLGCGPSLILPLFFVAKVFFSKKLIFFESWVRVEHKSISGKLIYPYCNLFFVQWPELQKKYKKSIYAGRLG